jgi:hypothetical protein
MKAKTLQAPTLKPTLEEIQGRFETWRSRKKAGSPIPKALWQAAVEQCRDHSILRVSRALRLNYNDLRNRVQQSKPISLPSSDGCVKFVELGLEGVASPPGCVVEIEAANGAKLRMHFFGQQRSIDAVALASAFLRQGS